MQGGKIDKVILGALLYPVNSRYIKIVAIVTMTIDHVGLLLFPNADWMRIVGRIAMPLFCLLVAYGVTKTRNPLKYFLRLFAFAVAVQIFFNLYMEGNLFAFYHWNVFFTLSLGVAAASFVNIAINLAKEDDEQKFGKALGMIASFSCVLATVFLAGFFPIDYGSAGVLLVVLFYLALRYSVTVLKITAVISLAVFNTALWFTSMWVIQWYAFLALPFILLFVDRKLRISVWEKYAFYIFYPLHFAVIYLIGTL